MMHLFVNMKIQFNISGDKDKARRLKMNNKTQTALKNVVNAFKTQKIPKAIAFSMFPPANIPFSNWSLINRTICLLSGTHDARGFKQWEKVGRSIKKGSKAIYILTPFFKKDEDENKMLSGFGCCPVFKIEDTQGEDVEYKNIKLPKFSLLDKAKKMGITTKAISQNCVYVGSYSSKNKIIEIATSEEVVFFHELSHAAHDQIDNGLKSGQEPLQEIIAELSAQSLCYLVGKSNNNTMGNSFRYIKQYAQKINMKPHAACIKVLHKVEQILNFIMEK